MYQLYKTVQHERPIKVYCLNKLCITIYMGVFIPIKRVVTIMYS